MKKVKEHQKQQQQQQQQQISTITGWEVPPQPPEEHEQNDFNMNSNSNHIMNNSNNNIQPFLQNQPQQQPLIAPPVHIHLIQPGVFDLSLPPISDPMWEGLRENQRQPDVTGWLLSEKLDGMRCYWNGVDLRTKNNNKIFAPAWFTEPLEKNFRSITLDGEIWIDRDCFQETMRICRR